MGFVKGQKVEVITNAPLKDPTEYRVMGYEVSLRKSEANLIDVAMEDEIRREPVPETLSALVSDQHDLHFAEPKSSKTLRIALVGNPNSGKTSLFNIASGTHERVGNYSGVTVDAKEGKFKYKDYSFHLVDLPGTYSLSTYTPEELYVRKQLTEEAPDLIINVVDASNLERNLYLTTQLIDMDVTVVIALNMYDELEKSGAAFDYEKLAGMIGYPIVPTVAKSGKGIDNLFDTLIEVYEGKNPVARHIQIDYTHLTEPHEDSEMAATDARYRFIDELLQQTYCAGRVDVLKTTRRIDRIVTDKRWGYPVFLLFMFVTFQATFFLGEYPMQWIESLIELLKNFVSGIMPEGPLKDLLVEGIIAGVGSVIVFLPNIVILYLFISFMEDTGYMARAAFIMDKLMQKMGLHGKSFIPLVMGFGCNVPAIMSTRIIESRNTRLITILVSPLMSCSARLPVYLLLIGAFFPHHGGFILFGLYLTGILLAIGLARLFKKVLVKKDDLPFVMELPPYRMPTGKAMFRHAWDKISQYLKKMGGIILIASIIVWFLGYYPKDKSEKGSYVEQIGRITEPVVKPLGFDWKLGASLISGMVAKEVVVSTLGVLYAGGEENEVLLKERINPPGHPVYTPVVALAFLVFVLIYFPCIATIAAIKNESGSWKWAAFVIVYTTALAWLFSFAVYRIGMLFYP
jgi:ferrous iron transport protein B